MDADEAAFKRRVHKLEVWKVLVSILTPIVLIALTFVVNNSIQERGALLKREEQVLAEKQKIYAELGRRLNVIYIYIADVGDFKSYTPPRIVEMKREIDRQFFMYRPYWSETTEKSFNAFMKAAFQTYVGAGKPAMINAKPSQKIAAYDVDKLQWDPNWNDYFTKIIDPEIEAKYYALVNSLLADTVSGSIRKLQEIGNH